MSSDGSLTFAVVSVLAIFGVVLHEQYSEVRQCFSLQLSTNTELCRSLSFASSSQPVLTDDYGGSREVLLQQAAEDIKQIADVH